MLNKLKPVNEGVMKTFNIELSLASSGNFRHFAILQTLIDKCSVIYESVV